MGEQVAQEAGNQGRPESDPQNGSRADSKAGECFGDFGFGDDGYEEVDGIPAWFLTLPDRAAPAPEMAPDIRPGQPNHIALARRDNSDFDVRASRAKAYEEAALEEIQKGRTPKQAQANLAAIFGISRRSAIRYLAHARERLAKLLDTDARGLRAESYARYLSLYENAKNPAAVRLGAAERIDKLTGVEAPQRIAIGRDGDLDRQAEIAAELPMATLLEIERASQIVDERRKAGSPKVVKNLADDSEGEDDASERDPQNPGRTP